MVAAACGNDDSGGGSDRDVFTDPNETIAVTAGESFFIELEGNATTGFSWQVSQEPDSAVAPVISDQYIPPENEDDRGGVGGTYVFELQAEAAGNTSVGFEDVPPGESPSGTPDEIFQITVS